MKRLSLVLLISLLIITACANDQPASPADPAEDPGETTAEAPPLEPAPETSLPAPDKPSDDDDDDEESDASVGLSKALADAGLKQADVTVLLDKKVSQGNRELMIVKFIHQNDYYFYKYRGDQLLNKVRSSADSLPPEALEGKLISEDEAKQIALKQAGVTSSQVSDLEVDIEERDDKIVYQVEFEVGDVDYDYYIDIYTGEIIFESIDD